MLKKLMLLALSWSLVLPAAAAGIQPFEIGLVPNLTARKLLTAFEPMRAYLENKLQQPVRLITAPNFREFFARTQKGEFDLVVTPAHFAWLAYQEAGYTPILTYTAPLDGLLVVARNSPIRSIANLRGKRIGIVDPLAIVTMRGLQVLREQGMSPGIDFSVQEIAPHNAAAVAVEQGHLDAAIIGSGPYRIMAENTRERLRVLSEVGSVPNAIYLLSKRIPVARQRELQAALLAFAATSAEGQKFMSEYRYGGFKTISAAELKPMEVYADQVKQFLNKE